MKSLVLIVLLVLAGIAGYNFINKPTTEVDTVTTTIEEIATPAVNEETVTEVITTEETETKGVSDENMTTPADMPEAAQQEMYSSMMEYNKCMMQDKPEYHQENMRTEDIAGKTLQTCEPKLDRLKAVLEENNVNVDLREGMVKTVRQRSTRKLMSAVMQSQAAGMMPMTAAPATTPVPTP